MSLDMRLLGDKFGDDGNNKASICARTIYDYYVRSTANRGTQFVFSDLSTYKPNEWNIYSDIKDKLVAIGFLPMKSSLSSAPRPNGRERNSLRT